MEQLYLSGLDVSSVSSAYHRGIGANRNYQGEVAAKIR